MCCEPSGSVHSGRAAPVRWRCAAAEIGQAGGRPGNGQLGCCLAVDAAVKVDDCSLGGHGGVAILCLSLLAANQDQKTPFELKRRKTQRGTKVGRGILDTVR